MTRSHKHLVFCATSAGVVIAALLVACSGDDGARTGVDTDAGSPAPATPSDAALPGDSSDRDARGPFDPNDEAVVCDASPCVTQLVSGSHHFCARTSDGVVRCWGDDEKGQCGLANVDGGQAGDAGGQGKPPVSELASVTQISAAGTTTCARVEAGAVYCWGGNAHGELGRTMDPPFDDEAHPRPERVALDEMVARVDVGNGSACATASGGEVYCWGNDESAQLARGAPSGPAAAPAPAKLGASVKRTAAGIDTGFALTSDGSLLTWGAVHPSATRVPF